LSPERIAQIRTRGELELSRKRVLNLMDAAQNPRHRAMLEKALADLDARLAALQ